MALTSDTFTALPPCAVRAAVILARAQHPGGFLRYFGSYF